MLRTALICVFMTACAGTAFAVNPPAGSAVGLVLHSTLESVTGDNSGIAAPVANVKAGETFTITGECVTRVQSAESLRVVLTLADTDSAFASLFGETGRLHDCATGLDNHLNRWLDAWLKEWVHGTASHASSAAR